MTAAAFDRDTAGAGVLERIAILGRHSDSPEHYTRTVFSAAHQAAARQIAAWMRQAGMEVSVDAIGNVRGLYRGTRREAREGSIVLGSHFDSVRNGGKYDGVLGILVPIACVHELHRKGERLRHDVEVIAFSDEEGARFQTSFLSSRALIGRFDPALLERRDADGVSLGEAMRGAGLDTARVESARLDASRIAAYVETHIEQGPVLLHEGAALGIVTTIAGGTRHLVRIKGEPGHAGTVPMALRHDALAAAAEMVLEVERRCSAGPRRQAHSGAGLVGTVGILKVKDGTGNVIPGEVELTVDIRSGDDAVREAAERDVFGAFDAIAARRGVRIEKAKTHGVHAVPCADWLQERLAASVQHVGVTLRRLPSGAGHDAMILAEVADVGMLFVRCGAGGVSHNPAETVTAADCGIAVEALLDFLRHFEPPREPPRPR